MDDQSVAFDGRRLRALRQRRGMRTFQLAAACGCTRRSIERWEAMTYREPRGNFVGRLAIALGCSVTDLYSQAPDAGPTQRQERAGDAGADEEAPAPRRQDVTKEARTSGRASSP